MTDHQAREAAAKATSNGVQWDNWAYDDDISVTAANCAIDAYLAALPDNSVFRGGKVVGVLEQVAWEHLPENGVTWFGQRDEPLYRLVEEPQPESDKPCLSCDGTGDIYPHKCGSCGGTGKQRAL